MKKMTLPEMYVRENELIEELRALQSQIRVKFEKEFRKAIRPGVETKKIPLGGYAS